jgi:hypothetical protein
VLSSKDGMGTAEPGGLFRENRLEEATR